MYMDTARVHQNSDDPLLRVSAWGYMTSGDIQCYMDFQTTKVHAMDRSKAGYGMALLPLVCKGLFTRLMVYQAQQLPHAGSGDSPILLCEWMHACVLRRHL